MKLLTRIFHNLLFHSLCTRVVWFCISCCFFIITSIKIPYRIFIIHTLMQLRMEQETFPYDISALYDISQGLYCRTVNWFYCVRMLFYLEITFNNQSEVMIEISCRNWIQCQYLGRQLRICRNSLAKQTLVSCFWLHTHSLCARVEYVLGKGISYFIFYVLLLTTN